MTICVLAIYEYIIINEIFMSCVIWRVDINYIDFTCVGISECGKRFEIVALDKNMIGSFRTGIGQCSFFVLD